MLLPNFFRQLLPELLPQMLSEMLPEMLSEIFWKFFENFLLFLIFWLFFKILWKIVGNFFDNLLEILCYQKCYPKCYPKCIPKCYPNSYTLPLLPETSQTWIREDFCLLAQPFVERLFRCSCFVSDEDYLKVGWFYSENVGGRKLAQRAFVVEPSNRSLSILCLESHANPF